MTAFFQAIAFLSRLPVGTVHPLGNDMNLGTASRWFPVAGLIIALPAVMAIGILSVLGAPGLLSAAIAIAALTATTGALHEDGLADCADGFGGSDTRDRKLEIMRDSRIGTYGTLALILSVTIRIACLAELLDQIGPFTASIALLAVSSVSRSSMVWVWTTSPSAREDGLARELGEPKTSDAQFAVICAVAILFSLVGPAFGLVPVVTCFVIAVISTYIWKNLCQSQIGGRSGDTLGATQQICEMSLFIALVITK